MSDNLIIGMILGCITGGIISIILIKKGWMDKICERILGILGMR